MAVVAVFFILSLILTDSLPTDLTMAALAIMLLTLILADFTFTRRSKGARITGIAIALIFILLFGSVTYYLGSAYAMMSKISVDSEDGSVGAEVTEKAFNVYITGIDQWAGDKGLDLERSDVNMIVSVNPVTKKVLLTSIPRDTYVMLHTAQQMDKLTHSGVYGVDETLNTVRDWLGVDLDYYLKLNFTGARDVINAIGGIEFYNPTEFKSSIKGYKYEKGNIKLNGKQALYYARERKAFEGKDYLRVENQQRVMKAILNKMLSSKTILLHFGEIMEATSKNVETDMPATAMQALVKMQMSDLSKWDIDTQKIEGEEGQDYVASLTQKYKFDIYRPYPESEEKCKKKIHDIENPSEEELAEAMERREQSFFLNLINHLKGGGEDEEEGEEFDVKENIGY